MLTAQRRFKAIAVLVAIQGFGHLSTMQLGFLKAAKAAVSSDMQGTPAGGAAAPGWCP